MVVHWEQLDEDEKARWLSLTSDDGLASYGQAVDRLERVNSELRRCGIVFHPVRLLFGIFEQMRMVRLLIKLRRAFEGYEKLLADKYASRMHRDEKERVLLIAFPKRALVLELESRGSGQLQRILRDIASI